ncbi:hypothetical protein [Streptomyces phyllanthi]|uniref:hypothetical protein n=1 Tax=Streptomyces phyllanthi TaxID=1803180 RepID=UPI001D15913D|nr:hypothetical protein [Streptomyces phyllanthi]
MRELSANRVAGVIIVPTARPHTESVKLLHTMPHLQLAARTRLRGSTAPPGSRTQPD